MAFSRLFVPMSFSQWAAEPSTDFFEKSTISVTIAWLLFDHAPNEFMAVSMLSLPSLFISSGVMTFLRRRALSVAIAEIFSPCLEKAFSGSNDIIVHCTKNAIELGAEHKKVSF